MAFLVRNVIEFNLLKGSTILAGNKGLNNEIVWINLMEILDTLDSLQKGELLITTGYELDNKTLFSDFIFKLKSKGLAGLAIQPGYYIDKIPKYIIEDGNKYDFPIIQIPSEITFSQITRILIKNINMHSNLTNSSELKRLQNFLKKRTSLEYNTVDMIEILPLDLNHKVYLFLLSVSHIDDGLLTEAEIEITIESVSSYFKSIKGKVILEKTGRKAVYIVSFPEEAILQDIIFDLSKILKKLWLSLPKLSFLIGCSYITGMDGLLAAFNEAINCQELLEKIGARKGVCLFEDLSLFKLLGILRSSDYALKFAYQNLKSVIDYDTIHKSIYMETLKYYLINGCNINTTSMKLYIHRHTLKYRLDKISELCGIDYKNYYSKIRFSMAIYIYDLFY